MVDDQHKADTAFVAALLYLLVSINDERRLV